MASGIRKISWRSAVKNLYIWGILIIFIAVFTSINEKFLLPPSLINIVRTTAPTILISSAATMLMISGYIDLSVGSIMGFCGVLFAILSKEGVPIWAGAILMTLLGALFGLLNGLLTVKLKIPAVIATLATMNILRGGAFLQCELYAQTTYIKGNLPKDFTFLGRGQILGFPVQVIFIIAIVAIFFIIEKRTLLGKYAIALGGNRTAAELSGVNVPMISFTLFILVGAVSGLSATVYTSLLTIGDPWSGIGSELDVIIAILLGGTSFAGGEGSVLGSLAGAFILGILGIGMNMIGVPSFFQYVVKGIVLILAILLDKFVKERICE